jgi:hypothetical protein
MAEYLMGCWDCTSCDRKGISGDAYSCDGCGAGRPEDVEFYLPTNAQVITDKRVIEEAEAGPDWKCEYCGEWQKAKHSTCQDCAGGGIKESERQKVEVREGRGESFMREAPEDLHDEYSSRNEEPPESFSSIDEEPISSFSEEPKIEKKVRKEPPTKIRKAPPSPSFLDRLRDIPWKVILGVLAGVWLFLWLFIWTSDVPAKITHHSWQRVQATEIYRTGIWEEGWTHPLDAYNIRSKQKIHHYDKVIDHYKTEPVYKTKQVKTGSTPIYSTRTVNLGNGKFKRESYKSGSRPTYKTVRYQDGTKQVPVYRKEPRYETYYEYQVDRWVSGPNRVTAGQGLNAQWPPTEVVDPSRERMSTRSATYTLHFQELEPEEEGKPVLYSSNLQEVEWRTWKDGETVILEVNKAGMVLRFRMPGNPEKG